MMTPQEIKDLLDNISTNPSTTSDTETWIICSREKKNITTVKKNWDDDDDSDLLNDTDENKFYMCVRGIHDGHFVWFNNGSKIERWNFETEGKKQYLKYSRWLRPKYYNNTYSQGGADFINDEEDDRFYNNDTECNENGLIN